VTLPSVFGDEKAGKTVVPLRDYPYFVDEIRRVLPKSASPRDAEADAPAAASAAT